MVIRSSPLLYLAATLLALAGLAGCGSSATTATSTGPTPINRCSVTVNGDGQVPAQGGNRSFSVSAARECSWSASVEGQWLAIRAGASGQGDGTVEVSAAANPDPQVRRGNVVLNEQRVELTQAAGVCSYSLSDSSNSFGQTGGSGAFDVRASSSLCSWTASSDSPWIAIRSGASGRGTAAVQFEVAAGTGAARTGVITAAGLRFGVTQAAAPPSPPPSPPPPSPAPPPSPPPSPSCSYRVDPTEFRVNEDARFRKIDVLAPQGCGWSASSNAEWIRITRGANGSGDGEVEIWIEENRREERVGTLTVAGQTVTVTQRK
jgi:Putative binding domain, N-terminal/Viral BACON domain